MSDPVPGSVQVPVSGSFGSLRVLHQIVDPEEPGDGLPADYTFGYVRFVDSNGVPTPVMNADIILHSALAEIDFTSEAQDPSYWRLRLWKGQSGNAYPAILAVPGAQTPSSLTLVIRDAVTEAPQILLHLIAVAGEEFELVAFLDGRNVPIMVASNL